MTEYSEKSWEITHIDLYIITTVLGAIALVYTLADAWPVSLWLAIPLSIVIWPFTLGLVVMTFDAIRFLKRIIRRRK